MTQPEVIIIGSGIGGATLAAALAPSGRRVLILERGEHQRPSAYDRDAQAIFVDRHYRSNEEWLDGEASILPTSAAVNPALTVAALAIETAEHLQQKDHVA